MLLGEILHREVIKTSLESTEKYAVIDELIDVLTTAKALTMAQRIPVREAVFEREKSMSTGMEMGIALPHGTCDTVEHLTGALGISRQGVEFDCLDCEPAHLILLLVLPRNEFQVHVRTLAGISHLLNDDRFRDQLLNAPDADAILKLIHKEERNSIFDGFRKRFK